MPTLTAQWDAGVAIMRGRLPDGRIVDVVPALFGAAYIKIGAEGKPWYDASWRYADLGIVAACAAIWDGTGRPLGWIKDCQTGEERDTEVALQEWLQPGRLHT